MTKTAWYEEAFGELYPRVYAHRDDARARHEVAFVRDALELTPQDCLIDVGCGAGRHLRAFAALGQPAHGLDLSKPLLAHAQTGHPGHVLRGDMRALPFAAESFDAAASFFTSFAFFPTQEQDQQVLCEIGRVVRGGGKYFLDYLDEAAVRRTLVPQSTRTVDDLEVRETRRIEDERVKKQVVISRDEEVLSRYEESVRLYSKDEIFRMLRSAGFEPWKTFGGYDGEREGEGSRLLIASRRETVS